MKYKKYSPLKLIGVKFIILIACVHQMMFYLSEKKTHEL